MRTTVTLDDQVAVRVQELAHRRQESFKRTLNALLRKALAIEEKPSTGTVPFVVKAHRGGFRPGVDLQKLNQFTDALEVEDFAREAGRDAGRPSGK